MDFDQFSLSMFEVACDGSACGSGARVEHVHPPQFGGEPIARVYVVDGRRIRYVTSPEQGAS